MTLEKEIPFFLKTLRNTIAGKSYRDGVVLIEVPGFTKDDLKITLDNYLMTVKGKKEILGELYEIDRSFILPDGCLNSNDPITAKVENGLLYINTKKSERAKQTVVDIS
jgi:HSP20 family molecular chaperone IbpA